jgi:hypothetical protein
MPVVIKSVLLAVAVFGWAVWGTVVSWSVGQLDHSGQSASVSARLMRARSIARANVLLLVIAGVLGAASVVAARLSNTSGPPSMLAVVPLGVAGVVGLCVVVSSLYGSGLVFRAGLKREGSASFAEPLVALVWVHVPLGIILPYVAAQLFSMMAYPVA